MNRFRYVARAAAGLVCALLFFCSRPAGAQFAFFADAFTNLGTIFAPEYVGPSPAPHEAFQFYYSAPPGWAVSDVIVTPSSATQFVPAGFGGLFVDQGFLTTSAPPTSIPDPANNLTPTLIHLAFPLSGNPKAGNGAFFQPLITDPAFNRNAEIILIEITTLDGTELLGPNFPPFGNGESAADLLSPPADTPAMVSAIFTNLDTNETMTLSGPFTILSQDPFTPDLNGLFASAVLPAVTGVPEPGALALLVSVSVAGGALIARKRMVRVKG